MEYLKRASVYFEWIQLYFRHRWFLTWMCLISSTVLFSQHIGKVERKTNLSDFPFAITSYDVSDGLEQSMVQEIAGFLESREILLANGSSFVSFNGYRFKKSDLRVEARNRLFFEKIFLPSNNHPLAAWYYGWRYKKLLILQEGKLLRELGTFMGVTSFEGTLFVTDTLGDLFALGHRGEILEQIPTGIPNISLIKPLNKDTFLLGNFDSVYAFSISGKFPARPLLNGFCRLIVDLPDHQDFLVVTTDDKLFRCNREWACNKLELPDPISPAFKDATVIGNKVFLTSFSGLYLYDGNEITCYRGKTNLPTNLLRSIYHDDLSGSIFIGTENMGLLQLTPKRFKNYFEPGESYGTSIQSLAKRDSNTIWFPGIKSLYEWSDGQIRELDFMNNESIYLIRIIEDSFLVVSRKNQLFAGSLKRPERLKQIAFPDYTVYDICRDQSGTAWGLTSHGLFRGAGLQSMKPYLQDRFVTDFTSFYETEDGTIWIGGYQQLLQVNRKGEIINHWGEADGLNRGEVRCFFEDEKGTLWIGTNGAGLFAFQNGQLIPLIKKNGYFLGTELFTLAPDNFGNILITTNNGLRVVSKQSLQQFLAGAKSFLISDIYSTSDGILNAEFNGRFSERYVTFDGQSFFFPTLQGIVQFESGPIESRISTLQLASVWVDNQQSDTLPRLIPDNTKEIVFEFAATRFIRSESLRFQYEVIRNGVSAGWSGLSASNQFRYVFPEYGRYILKIRAFDGSNRNGVKPLVLQFDVNTPFYKTRSFLFFSLISLFVVIISLWDNWVDRHQKKIRREYQLRDTINELQIQAIQAQLNPELIFNSLQFIDALVKKGELEKAENVLVDFSSLIRLILENKNNIFIEVGQEATLFLLFAELESIRMNRRLAYSFSYKEAISQRSIPSMMIFPFLVELVEKVFGKQKKEGYINAEVLEQGNGIRLVIECGITSIWPEGEPSMENLVINSLEMVRKKGNVLLSKYYLNCELATFQYVQKEKAVRKLEITITNHK